MENPQQQQGLTAPHTCLFCGHPVQLVPVHVHYQCPVCHTNALPCCDGDNCSTNLLLANTLPQNETEKS